MKVLGLKTEELNLFLLAVCNYCCTQRARSLALLALFFVLGACSTTERPANEMIFASAAMRAAQQSFAEKKAPDLYRRAENAFWRAKRFYLAKDYEQAKKSAYEARRLAEQAELEAELKAGAGDDWFK